MKDNHRRIWQMSSFMYSIKPPSINHWPQHVGPATNIHPSLHKVHGAMLLAALEAQKRCHLLQLEPSTHGRTIGNHVFPMGEKPTGKLRIPAGKLFLSGNRQKNTDRTSLTGKLKLSVGKRIFMSVCYFPNRFPHIGKIFSIRSKPFSLSRKPDRK